MSLPFQQTLSPLAAAATGSDPFGLGGQQIMPGGRTPIEPTGVTPTSQTPTAPTPPTVSSSTPPSSSTSNNAPNPNDPLSNYGGYDLTTDPVLQMVQASTTAANSMAQATALRQQEQLLLAYGDPTLASAVLGANDPIVAALQKGNPESTLSMLGRQHDQQVTNFDTGLDPSLTFSGYRVKQEGLLNQNYLDALANAAASVQTGLGGIGDNLNNALAGDNTTLQNAIADAYARAVAAALTNPPAPDAPPTYTPPGPGDLDPWLAAYLARTGGGS